MSLSRSIGGYFELELNKNEEYHKSAIKLNTGRNAFEYVLRANNYRKIYLPYYTCDVMLEPIKKLNLEYEFYKIDNNFFPKINLMKLNLEEVLIYNNYFGICDKIVNEICDEKNVNIIIDNSQSFYSKPEKNYHTFYSARKFFGVPDGAYLYTNKRIAGKLEFDLSQNRMEHLFGRIESTAEKYYPKFIENEESLTGQPIKKMSKLTQRLLKNIDYGKVAEFRTNNFNFLHSKLKDTNEMSVDTSSITVPMVYPYLVKNGSVLKKKLVSKKIFLATYWPNIKVWDTDKNSFENYLAENLLALPIDQRYDLNDMKVILSFIKNNEL